MLVDEESWPMCDVPPSHVKTVIHTGSSRWHPLGVFLSKPVFEPIRKKHPYIAEATELK